MSVALPLFEPGLYHDLGEDNSAYFGTFRKLEGGKVAHRTYDVRDMPEIVRAAANLPDFYISQGDFRIPKRAVAALKSLGLFWADLGDNGELAKLGDAGAVEAIRLAVKEADIAYPSFIVASGRGFHAKWLFLNRVSWEDLARWNALEKTVVQRLHAPLDADLKATDAARVLRLVDTINSRTNTITRIVWRNLDASGEIVRYDFEALYRSIVPSLEPYRNRTTSGIIHEARNPGLYVSTEQTWEAQLWLDRLADERTLFRLRNWTPENGGVPKGYRDWALFVGATALTWFAPTQSWWNETQALSVEFAPGLRETEWRSYVSSTWKKMQAGDRYRYRNDTLARIFDVSREEMAHLKTFVDQETQRERHLEYDRKYDERRRRERGEVDRLRYLAEMNERTLRLGMQAQEIIARGLSLRKTAELLDVSLGSIQNAIRVARRDV